MFREVVDINLVAMAPRGWLFPSLGAPLGECVERPI